MAKNSKSRYSDAQKKEVVDFVNDYNKKNGRGGQSAAAKKYKITAITIANWLGKNTSSGKKRKAGKKIGRQRGSSGPEKTLLQMADIQTKIRKLESEYSKLKKRI